MSRSAEAARFEALFVPHMDAAYDLARWLTRDEAAAQDVVQESYLRAFRFIARFDGGNARAWLLTIVRNQCYTWLKASPGNRWLEIEDDVMANEPALIDAETPELAAIRDEDGALLQTALAAVPPIFREVIVLRELENMTYKEIAVITGAPLGTIMSRLARARAMLKRELIGLRR